MEKITMMGEHRMTYIAYDLLEKYKADKGWTFHIVDHLDGLFGFTDFEAKIIKVSRAEFPTYNRNIVELIRHEVAHVLVHHGLHNLEWWDKLIEIGGCGVWVNEWGTVEQARISD